jgi:ATP-dependent DNA ligase
MYPACCVERCLLAMMRYAAYLSFETPRPCKGQFGKQASGAEIGFLEWTGADHLRHTKFVALRDDKDPKKVVRET